MRAESYGTISKVITDFDTVSMFVAAPPGPGADILNDIVMRVVDR